LSTTLSSNLEAPGDEGLIQNHLLKISLNNQDKEESAKSSLSVNVKKLHQLRKKGENLKPEN